MPNGNRSPLFQCDLSRLAQIVLDDRNRIRAVQKHIPFQKGYAIFRGNGFPKAFRRCHAVYKGNALFL